MVLRKFEKCGEDSTMGGFHQNKGDFDENGGDKWRKPSFCCFVGPRALVRGNPSKNPSKTSIINSLSNFSQGEIISSGRKFT